MVLKVDLQCDKCYRKVRKVLCKFPQIRDQMYDEKNNQVIIKVVCCSPEKIRDKLCCKGCGVIKSIDIKEPPPPEKVKPPPPEKVKPPPEKLKPPAETVKPPPPEKPPPVTCPRPPVNTCCTECLRRASGWAMQTGYGYGVPDPYIQYDGYCGRPVYDSYGGWRSYNTSSYCETRPDCSSEENPQACAIM
ncbi:hypothetical protein M0R45_008349 [Rubus argutus]|uniref:Uncharacterized protein n=1 Tax=Rubus argutus TaxID=59490 RepID=A0AAW1Y102_RUBAR